MKRVSLKFLILLGVIVVFSISNVFSVSAATSKTKTYVGYLMDAHCWKKGVDDQTGKINVKKNPEKHTTSCLKIQMCMDEGLGIMVKQSNGKYTFYKFDKAGSKKADDKIMMMTKRKFGNKISVTGILSRTTLKVSSIKEVK